MKQNYTNGPRGINKIPRVWEHLTEERFYVLKPQCLGLVMLKAGKVL